ncbi:MAG: hypothetical protein IJF41_00230 [Clostridia bacterium]|nr:hypothetical protein [Clostridia bacterium]
MMLQGKEQATLRPIQPRRHQAQDPAPGTDGKKEQGDHQPKIRRAGGQGDRGGRG